MNDEVDTFGAAHADLEELARTVGSDEHHEVVEPQDTDGVPVGVEDVVVVDTMFSGTGEDDRIHVVNLS